MLLLKFSDIYREQPERRERLLLIRKTYYIDLSNKTARHD